MTKEKFNDFIQSMNDFAKSLGCEHSLTILCPHCNLVTTIYFDFYGTQEIETCQCGKKYVIKYKKSGLSLGR